MNRVRSGLPALLVATVWLAGPLSAQEPDSIPAPGEAREGIAPAMGECTLRWRPLEADTRSFTNRDVAGEHVTHLSGRYLWTCGSAAMEADSAIKRDGPRQVELIGRVVYEDTIRTLKSDRLLYFQLSDFIIVEDNVELVRLVDGSTLTGPRVEFLRAVSGVDAFTTAPGRPTVTFYPEHGESGEPFEVEADVAVFAGEDEARFAGDAVISRSDFNAGADTASLTREDGLGVMWGEPWIEAEGIRLEGDTIRFRSENEELEEVRAIGGGYAAGENYEVRAEAIDIELDNRDVKHVWAHGEGLGEAVSGSHVLYGDSLHFVMYRSQIDTAYSVGDAVAIQRDTTVARPDTLAGPTESDSAAAPRDSAAAATGTEADAEAEAEVELGRAEGAESEESQESQETEDGESEASGGPELALDGSMNWARADTLIAIFERPDDAAADSVAVAEPAMSRLILAGGASALYRMVRDSMATSRPSRNYLVGVRIQVDFEDGEPLAVAGDHAIGVYLEPREVFGEASGGEQPADSADVASDTPADTTSAGDAAGSAPGDSARVASDTLSTTPDTSSAPPDTLRSDGRPRLQPLAAASGRSPPERPARGARPAPAHRSRRMW
ncbi:hypothetical protein [Candidatus Palauibacter sp.]|uniref:hypothetical protein n=1 Tax=Candidatus Palauibacter sp. TaxID=3101350 RepID=UPI003C70371F